MAEINYDFETTRSNKYPKIKKLGICSPGHEMTPFVWKGKLMRMEMTVPTNELDPDRERFASIRDCESGKIISTTAYDCYFHSAYVEEDVAYVLAVDLNDRSTIRIFESHDLVNWTDRVLLTNPGWVYYNTSLTKGPDGYVLCIEASEPAELIGEPFTMFFATSPDLVNWTHMTPDHCFSRERYNGGPWMRYSEGWYYLISVTMLPCRRFTNYIFRTQNFLDWEVGFYNPILMPSEEDHIISPNACELTEDVYKYAKCGFNINNSDLDMCDWNGKVYINYTVSNQLGTFGYMCEAEVEGTVAEFLKSYFE